MKDKFTIECVPFSEGIVMDQERRRSPRFPFIASAEVLSENADTRLAARISDLSATGCYVDTRNPLVDGTAVRLKILTETQVFEAPATVVYSHSHLGRGLIFGEVLGNSRNVLQNWLPVASYGQPDAQLQLATAKASLVVAAGHCHWLLLIRRLDRWFALVLNRHRIAVS